MKKHILFAALLTLGLTGCDTKSPYQTETKMAQTIQGETEAQRFQVRLLSTFRDEIAYMDYRGIYIIVDTKTGKEYVGVSGVGISELGQHQQGKTPVSDER